MKYNTYKKICLALSTAMILTACGGGGGTPHEPTGLDRIVEYAQNGGTVPTLQDYIDAGVIGIDSEAKLAEINQVIEGLVAQDVDTTEEVQALADALGVQVPAGTVAPSPSPDTTAPVIGLTGANPMNITQGNAYTEAGATATDDVDGTVSVTSTGTVDTTTLGSYTITYTATDTAGNTATETRTVNVQAPTITHNGTTYGIVTSPYTGKVWLDRNLGAAQVCTSFDDTACYGDYYQWGRNYDGHQDSTSDTTDTQAADINNAGSDFITSDSTYDYDWAKTADSDGSLRQANWSATDGSSVCPVGFRVPDIDEFKAELFDAGSAQIQNREDAFNSFLALPSAGYRSNNSASLYSVGSWGGVWAGSVDGSDSRFLGWGSVNAYWNNTYRADGLSVRCLRD